MMHAESWRVNYICAKRFRTAEMVAIFHFLIRSSVVIFTSIYCHDHCHVVSYSDVNYVEIISIRHHPLHWHSDCPRLCAGWRRTRPNRTRVRPSCSTCRTFTGRDTTTHSTGRPPTSNSVFKYQIFKYQLSTFIYNIFCYISILKIIIASHAGTRTNPGSWWRTSPGPASGREPTTR